MDEFVSVLLFSEGRHHQFEIMFQRRMKNLIPYLVRTILKRLILFWYNSEVRALISACASKKMRAIYLRKARVINRPQAEEFQFFFQRQRLEQSFTQRYRLQASIVYSRYKANRIVLLFVSCLLIKWISIWLRHISQCQSSSWDVRIVYQRLQWHLRRPCHFLLFQRRHACN
jgi:hypothetical protein